jgi:predicted permease
MEATPDWRVVGFALAAGFVSAVVFGLTPALQIGRQRQKANVARQALIAAQVAASCVLLIVTGLLARAIEHATWNSPGYEYRNVIAVSPDLERNGYTPARAQAYCDAFESRLRGLPGVQAVSLALSPPLGHVTITVGTEINGHPAEFNANHVSAEYFATMGIPIVRGRSLQPGERHAIVIGDDLARAVWPNAEPLGQSIELGDRFQVVGIAGRVQSLKFGDTDKSMVYFPIEEGDYAHLSVLVKSAGAPQEMARSAVAAARSLDPKSFPEVDILSSAYRRNLEGAEFLAMAVSSLASIAQLLACMGIVGVVSYAVSQRTKEIGIRMALGAKAGSVLRVVLGRLAGPVAAGLILGVACAGGLAQFLRGRLFGISHLDPAAYVGAVAVFVATAAVAAAFPAQRALRIDPLRALRHE